MHITTTALAALAIGAPALAGFTTIDFSVEDDGVTPLVNGQEINSPGEFGNLFTITSPTGNRLAIFDSSDPGPNVGGGDPDLLVNLGNVLIIQNNNLLTQSTPGIFDTPDDSAGGGEILFSFLNPAELGSLDLIDVDDANGVIVTLTDDQGRQRVYDVPKNFSNEIDTDGPMGFETLSLVDTTPQLGEGGGTATLLSEDAGYDPLRVATLKVLFTGSGGLDNLTLVPTPGAAALLGCSGLMGLRRQRA